MCRACRTSAVKLNDDGSASRMYDLRVGDLRLEPTRQPSCAIMSPRRAAQAARYPDIIEVSLTSEDLQQLLVGIRSRDPETYESAYDLLRPVARNWFRSFLRSLRTASDAFTRGKFIELLGHSRSARVVPTLAAELGNTDQNVRQWAVTALREVATPDALNLVHEYERVHPEEF